VTVTEHCERSDNIRVLSKGVTLSLIIEQGVKLPLNIEQGVTYWHGRKKTSQGGSGFYWAKKWNKESLEPKIPSRKERHLELYRGLCQSNRWVI